MNNDSFSLNIRLLGILVLVGVVACVGVFLLHKFQLQRQSDFFLDKARLGVDALPKAEGPLDEAEKVKAIGKNFARYLKHNRDDYKVASELAILLADTGESLLNAALEEKDIHKQRQISRYAFAFFGEARVRLENLLRSHQNQVDLRTRLVELLFKQGNWSDAIEHIRFLVTPPTDVTGLAKLFDEYDLWRRMSPPVLNPQHPKFELEPFLNRDNGLVDKDKLLTFLGDDIWMILNDVDLLEIYGRCQAIQRKYTVAENSFEKAIYIVPDDPDLYERLALILRGIQPPRPADADYWINEMVASNPHSYEARLKRARYWNMVAVIPGTKENGLVAKKSVLDALGGMQQAITIIADEADLQAPSLPETLTLKAAINNLPSQPPRSYNRVTSDYKEGLLSANKSALALEDKLKGVSDEIEACRDGLLLAAQSEWLGCWLKKDNTKESLADARHYAEFLTNLFPEYSSGYAVLAEIDLQSGDRESAIVALSKGSKACIDNTNLLWRLASLLIDSGKIEEAKKVCTQIDASDIDRFAVDHLNARIAYSEKRWLEAAKGFEEVRDELVRRWPSRVKRLDFMLAECYGHLGHIDKQRDAYLRASSTDRTWLPALLGIAKNKAKAGQIDEAIDDYQLIIRLKNSPKSASFELARLLFTKNLSQPKDERNWKKLEQLVESLEKKKSDPLRVALLKADIYFSQGDDTKAAAVLGSFQQQFSEEQKTLQSQIEAIKQSAASLSGDDLESAREEIAKLQLALKKNVANQTGIWTALVSVAKRNKDWDAAETAINEITKLVGDSATLRLTHGEYLLARLGPGALDHLRNLAGGTKDYSQAERVRLWRGLAGLSLRAGDYAQAKILSQGVLNYEPGNMEMQIIRFEVAVREKDFATLRKILDEIKEGRKDPGTFWHYGQAVFLNMSAQKNDVKQINQAQRHIEEALRLRPSWKSARVVAATIYDRQGNFELAVENYRKAIDLGENSSQLILRTVELLNSLDRPDEASKILRLASERQDSVTGEADIETSVLKARTGKYEDALDLARKVAAKSNKAEDHVWLGQLLLIVGQRAKNQQRQEDAERDLVEAENAFKHAVELDPSSDKVWIAMIQFYGQTEQINKAEAAIAEARANLPPEKVASAIAQCYEAIGNKKEAEKQLLLNTAKSPNNVLEIEKLASFYMRNEQHDKAIVQLKKIISGEVQSSAEQKSEARRSYATILLRQGGEANRKMALEQVEKNLRLNSSSQDDQYAKAVLLANDPETTQRKKAIPMLEKLLDAQHSPSTEIQFMLAKLYLSEEQFLKFKNLMRNILRGKVKDPRYLTYYTEALLERDELKEASIYVKMLEKTAPDEINTHIIASKYAFKEKNYQTAIVILKQFLGIPQPDRLIRMRDLVEIANTLADYASDLRESNSGQSSIAKTFDEEAEAVYREFVSMQPGRELLMAQFLNKQGRLKEAIQLTKKHAANSTGQDVAKTCFSFLQGNAPNSAQLEQIDKILDEALKRDPLGQGANVIKTAIAVLRDFQGRSEDTELLYRDILKSKPDDPTAMNNLAVFLALRNRNIEEAYDLINKAITKYGRIPGLLDTRALVYLARRQPKMALDDLSLALKKQPTAIRYFHQAQAYFQDGQRRAAIKALDTAHKMGLKDSNLVEIERRNYQKLTRSLR